MPVDASVYSQLARPPQFDVGTMLGLMNQANQLKRFNAEQAAGQAYQQATDPSTGQVNPGTVGQLISQNPDAALAAPAAAQNAANLSGTYTANAAARTALSVQQTQFIRDSLGALAGKPDLTKADLIHNVVAMSRNVRDMPTEMLDGIINGAPDDPKALRQYVQTLQAQGLGASGTAGRVAGPPGPGGAPTQIPMGAAVYGQPSAAMPGAITTGQRPGLGEAQAAVAAQGAHMANDLTQANDTSMVRKAMLGNLEDDLSRFTAGPGADWTRVGKAWVNRNVPLPPGWQFDPHSIASQEQFNKQAMMLAQQQFQAIGGTGTDEKFSSAFHTSPNETLSQLGNQGIIRLLKGNEDAVQAKTAAWRDWLKGNPAKGVAPHDADSYADFSSEFNSHFDPRAFQFKYIPKGERQAYFDKMSPDEQSQFAQNLAYAHQRGWVSFDQPQAKK